MSHSIEGDEFLYEVQWKGGFKETNKRRLSDLNCSAAILKYECELLKQQKRYEMKSYTITDDFNVMVEW